ncbi:MAG: helix-turn-helix transcriptional regulator [Lachnospiraceae bacterium]|nr:helix-turn-helix transcriptional regulator [Lachnospiraceae bacterium]
MATTIIGMGDIVREKRKSLLMSQSQLAEKIGVCKRTIIDIETNIGNPKFDVLFRLFRELNIPLEQIFYPEIQENFEEKNMLMQELMGCSEREIAVILPVVINMKQTLRDKNRKKKQRKVEWKQEQV